MSAEPLVQLRRICLALPETSEVDGSAEAGFRVRDKIFAMRHRVAERDSVWFKAEHGERLVHAAPGQYFRPPYVDRHGWIGAWLDVEQDWDELAALLVAAHQMTAPELTEPVTGPG